MMAMNVRMVIPAVKKAFVISLLMLTPAASISVACPAEGERLAPHFFLAIERRVSRGHETEPARLPFKNAEVSESPTVKKQVARISPFQAGVECADMLTLQEKVFYDGLGIPLVDYGYIDGVRIGVQRNPVTVAQKSWIWLRQFEQTKDTYSYNYFFNCAQWLIENSKPFSGGLILPYKFEYPPYGLKPEWYSAMAQGQAVQTMVRAYRLSQNKAYLDFAKKMLKPLWVEVKNGGVTVRLSENAWWYEEYASKSVQPPMALNGTVFCLLGIHEYYLETGDEEARELFFKGTSAVLSMLDRFDCNGWSYYDLRKKVATYHYHRIHVNQMLQMYEITGEEKFLFYHNRWKAAL